MQGKPATDGPTAPEVALSRGATGEVTHHEAQVTGLRGGANDAGDRYGGDVEGEEPVCIEEASEEAGEAAGYDGNEKDRRLVIAMVEVMRYEHEDGDGHDDADRP